MFMTFTVRFDETTGNLRPWEVVLNNTARGEIKVVSSCSTEESAIKSAKKKVATNNKCYGRTVAAYEG